jgi:hypothetical protein
LVYAGKTLQEIAGLDVRQMRLIYFRPRDKFGNLKRVGESEEQAEHPTAPYQVVSYEAMFRQIWANRGKNKDEVETLWQGWLVENPSYVELMRKKERQRERRMGI